MNFIKCSHDHKDKYHGVAWNEFHVCIYTQNIIFYAFSKILKAKNEEKLKAIDSNTKYYRSVIDELNKTKKN